MSQTKQIPTKMETVRLYHQGATVKRVAHLTLDPNEECPKDLAFTGLPLALMDQTVRIQIRDSEWHTTPSHEPLLAISNFRVGLTAIAPEEAISPPDQQAIDTLKQTIQTKQILLQHIEHEQQFLENIQLPDRPAGETGKAPPMSPMAARVALEQFTHDSIEQRIEERQTLQAELEELTREAAALRQRINEASSAQEVKAHALRKMVYATLQCEQGTQLKHLTLELEYFVPGARWAPSYHCRLQPDGQAATIQMRAMVSQATGEDWTGVKLELSTASPMRWTEIPKLGSLRIGRAQPPQPARKGFRPPPHGAQALFANFDQAHTTSEKLLPHESTWTPPSLYTAPINLAQHVQAPPTIQQAPFDTDRYMYTSMEELDEPSPIVEERYESQLRDKKEVYDEAPEAPKMKKIRSAMAAAPPAPPKPSPVGGGGFGGLVASGAAFSSFADGLTEASEYEELDFDEEDDVLAVLAEKPAAPRKKKGKRAKKRPAPGGSSRTTSQLLYTELQLHAATHSQRGQLEPTDPTTTYIESLQTLSLQINIDVMAVVRNAQEHARTHDHKSLPPGTFDPKQHTGHFDYTYQTDTTVDVPSNGFAHSIAVGSRDAECDLQYVVVPREDTHVYRMALLRNPLHAPLLPGPADIYVGDEYILSTQLPVVAPTGEFRLWLGVEQAIKCARNARFEERRSGTKVVAMTELHHALDIELTNRLPRTIQCEVRERIPYPAPDAEVVVEEGNITPTWEAYEQEERGHILKGGRRWHVSIPAGDTTKLNADYTIKIYANNELIGGNRREA